MNKILFVFCFFLLACAPVQQNTFTGYYDKCERAGGAYHFCTSYALNQCADHGCFKN